MASLYVVIMRLVYNDRYFTYLRWTVKHSRKADLAAIRTIDDSLAVLMPMIPLPLALAASVTAVLSAALLKLYSANNDTQPF